MEGGSVTWFPSRKVMNRIEPNRDVLFKGGLIANLHAVKVPTEAGAVPEGTVMFFSTNEEVAGTDEQLSPAS
jgi:hypothetical protein